MAFGGTLTREERNAEMSPDMSRLKFSIDRYSALGELPKKRYARREQEIIDQIFLHFAKTMAFENEKDYKTLKSLARFVAIRVYRDVDDSLRKFEWAKDKGFQAFLGCFKKKT